MTAPLELAQNALCGHLALEMFDRTLDALVTDLDLEGLTLNCFAGKSHEARAYDSLCPAWQAFRAPPALTLYYGYETGPRWQNRRNPRNFQLLKNPPL